MLWAIVPAKLATSAKERLGPVLSPVLRERLARAMLSDVLHALTGCPQIGETLVVSRDREALALARDRGALGLEEQTRDGLNASISEAISYSAQRGATAAVIAMGDLPLLESADVSAAIDRAPARGVVLVPSRDGTGTNLVVTRPTELLVPQFGPGSLEKHLAQIRRREIEPIVYDCPGAALDVDTPDDLARLEVSPRIQSATRKLLLGPEARESLGAS